MTVKEASHLIKDSIQDLYDSREINAITEWILEALTGLTRVDRLLLDSKLDVEQEKMLKEYVHKLSLATPVQYVTGYAWFMGIKLRVNEHVLIPRPETEELVKWTLNSLKPGMKAIDIGTGSGCIPILLKQEIPEAELFAIDVSSEALEIAQQNAESLGLNVQFVELDILNAENWNRSPQVDIIISNPPYIPFIDKHTLDKHVVEYEPHLALFVPEHDPLLFYSTIIRFAETKLNTGGKLFFETHFALAKEVAALTNWSSEIQKDIFGKERMVCITKP